MTLLKSIPVLILFAFAATSSPSPPCEVGVRGRNYGANIFPNVNPSTLQSHDYTQLEVLKNLGFYIPPESIIQSFGTGNNKGGRVKDSANVVHPDGDDYFDSEFRNGGEMSSRDLREDSSRLSGQILRQVPPYGLNLEGRRPSHLYANPAGGRQERESGYNYQGGTLDVQIHQHIHEYLFNDATPDCTRGKRCNTNTDCCLGETCNKHFSGLSPSLCKIPNNRIPKPKK